MNQQTYTKETNTYTLVIDVKETAVNTANNTSDVYFYFKINSTKYDFSHKTRIKVWINDRYVYDDTRTLTVPTYDSTYLATDTVTVPHDSDGTKKCEVFAELVFLNNPGAYYLPQDPIIAESGRTGYMFELTHIAQASLDFKSFQNFYIGQIGQVEYKPSKSNTYYFRFAYRYKKKDGSFSQWIYPNGMTAIKGDQTSFKIPEYIGNEIPYSDTCEGQVWAGLFDSASSGRDWIVDRYKTVNFYIANSDGPEITSINLSETNTNISDKFDIFVAGYSKVKIEPSITPKLGASISKVKIEILDNVYEQSSVIVPIPRYTYTPGTSTKDIKITAIDSRGNTTTKESVIEAYRYSEPSIKSLDSYFNDQGKGTFKVQHICYSLTSKNSKKFTVKYKRKSETSWKTYTITPNRYDGTIIITVEDIVSSASWDVEVIFSDSLAQDTRTTSLIQISGLYITFVSDELNENVPNIEGRVVTIPSTKYYKQFRVQIINRTPSSHRLQLQWEQTISKQFISKWVDKSTNTFYNLGQTVTLTKSLKLHPVFEDKASDITLPNILNSFTDVQPLGYSEVESGANTLSLTHTFTNLKRDITLYLKYKVKFSISGNTGKVTVTQGDNISGYDEYIRWKNNWEDLDLNNLTFDVVPPQIQNENTEDGEYTSEFLGWDKDIPKIYKQNIPYYVKAMWKKKTFTVRFYEQRDGRLLKQIDNVEYGTGVTPPPNPSFPGKVFRGWSSDYKNIKRNKDIYGIWGTANIWIMSKDHVWVPYLPQEG